jgi:hypothetical protein
MKPGTKIQDFWVDTMFFTAILKMEKESSCDTKALTYGTMRCFMLKTTTETNKANLTDKAGNFHRKTRLNWHNFAKTGA